MSRENSTRLEERLASSQHVRGELFEDRHGAKELDISFLDTLFVKAHHVTEGNAVKDQTVGRQETVHVGVSLSPFVVRKECFLAKDFTRLDSREHRVLFVASGFILLDIDVLVIERGDRYPLALLRFWLLVTRTAA